MDLARPRGGGGGDVSGWLVIHGDCRKLPLDLAAVDCVVTDPPYGIGYVHSGGGNGIHPRKRRKSRLSIIGDDQPFDPVHWLGKPCLLWGAHHYARRLPESGSWLAWDKSCGKGPADSFSDCDFAWCSMLGIKRNIFRFLWKGVACVKIGEGNRGSVYRYHPSQKPIALMRWCIRLMKLPPNSLILDPYCGSGSTIIAALAEGHRAIGVEKDARYCAIARRRIERPHSPAIRPAREEHFPLFDGAAP
jgi:site-specific DNA-methyltransferase (adenine-specific)